MPSKRVSEKEIAVSAAVPARHKPATTARAKRSVPAAAPAAAPALAATVTQPKPAAPSREAIARLAYTYWEGRGCQGGSPEEDWVRAERELASAAIA